MPQFLGEPTDYVLNQVIDTVLGKDKDFQAWRAEHRSPSCRAREHSHRHDAAPSDSRRIGTRRRSRAGRQRGTVRDGRRCCRRVREQRRRSRCCSRRALAPGVQAYPLDRANVFLELIELRSPAVF